MCICVSGVYLMLRGQKEASDPLTPELQAVASCLIPVLKTEPWSSVRAASAFKHSAICPALNEFLVLIPLPPQSQAYTTTPDTWNEWNPASSNHYCLPTM